jgi:hypothetical protein
MSSLSENTYKQRWDPPRAYGASSTGAYLGALRVKEPVRSGCTTSAETCRKIKTKTLSQVRNIHNSNILCSAEEGLVVGTRARKIERTFRWL